MGRGPPARTSPGKKTEGQSDSIFLYLARYTDTVKRYFFSILVLLCCTVAAFSQNQLVLLKNEKIKLRLYPGDDFVYRLKGSKTIHTSYVNNISDTAVVAHNTIVPFYKIDRIYFKHHNFKNVIGGLLVVGGIGYFAIDQLNVTLVRGDKANLDEGVTTSSVVMVGAGLPLLLINKKSEKLGGRFRLLFVKKGSAFYRPDPRLINSDFNIDN